MGRRSLAIVLLIGCAEPARVVVARPEIGKPAVESGGARLVTDAGLVTATAPVPTIGPDAAGEPLPSKPTIASPVVSVAYVDLAGYRGELDIDAERHVVFAESAEQLGGEIETTTTAGVASDRATTKLVEAMERARLCSIQPPDKQLYVWTEIRVELPKMKCSIRLDPASWRKRSPSVINAVRAVEEEVCGPSKCHRPARFD